MAAFTINFSQFTFFLCYFILHSSCQAISMRNCSIDAIYQFGDSLADTGNAVRLLSFGQYLPANRLPYGETFPGNPTGRWSDGRLIVDVMAEALGLEPLDPYLDLYASFKSGVNFAVAGATALDRSTLYSKGISGPMVVNLQVQISWFKAWIGSYCSTLSECSKKLSNSLIFFGEIGGNDMNYAISQNKSIEELRALVPSLTEAIVQGLQDMMGMGARKFVVPGNFPIGCIPFAMASLAEKSSGEYDEFGCLKTGNDLAMYQNQHLQSALQDLTTKFPHAIIVYFDYYNAFMHLIRHASTLGFNGNGLICCGGGDYNFRSRKFCGGGEAPVCENPNQYIHWDGVHLTQAAYTHMFNFLSNNVVSSFGCTS